MTFRIRHIIFGDEQVCDEANLPSWLTHRAFKWFLDAHVLTMKVGETAMSDFHRITRVS